MKIERYRVTSSLIFSLATEALTTQPSKLSLREIARITKVIALRYNQNVLFGKGNTLPSHIIDINEEIKVAAWEETGKQLGEITAGLPTLIYELYVSEKELLDTYSNNTLLRHMDSMVGKLVDNFAGNSYKVGDLYVKVLNKIIYDMEKKHPKH